MEFLTAPLARHVKGDCAGCCTADSTLTCAVMQVADNAARRNAMNQPLKDGKQAHLICDSCAKTHPIWRTVDQPEKDMAHQAD